MYKRKEDKPQVGISSYLLGQEVRFDGYHNTQVLKHYFHFVPLCPEVVIQLGVRSPSTKRQHRNNLTITQSIDGKNLAKRLNDYSTQAIQTMGELSGYILCRKPPSSRMEGDKTYHEEGSAKKTEGSSTIAQAIIEAHPGSMSLRNDL